MNAEIQIHPELRSVKSHALPVNPWALAALQTVLQIWNRVHCRRYKHILTRTRIQAVDGHLIPALIIRPEPSQPLTAGLIYFHGGAFVLEGAPQHIDNAVRYALEADCKVFFVEYRLAPKHVFPTGLNDCHTVLRWVVSNAAELGVDIGRIAVGGDSAGGNLAAAIAQRAVQEDHIALKGQLLLYPAVDLICDRPSMKLFSNVPPFKDLSGMRIATTYLGQSPTQPLPQYSSPIAGSLAGLPPAYIETPQLDPLHDQGIAYATALRNNGNEVELNDIGGAIHGFDIVAASSSLSRQAMTRRIQFLRRIFS